jgi:hypothetical protein
MNVPPCYRSVASLAGEGDRLKGHYQGRALCYFGRTERASCSSVALCTGIVVTVTPASTALPDGAPFYTKSGRCLNGWLGRVLELLEFQPHIYYCNLASLVFAHFLNGRHSRSTNVDSDSSADHHDRQYRSQSPLAGDRRVLNQGSSDGTGSTPPAGAKMDIPAAANSSTVEEPPPEPGTLSYKS